MKNITNLNRY